MSLEAAVVIDIEGEVLHWHLPLGRTAVLLPDSRKLWDVLWQHRVELLGVAHTHPGAGQPSPSLEDLTTFAACEAGLGKRLRWWIATNDQVVCYMWTGPSSHAYSPVEIGPTPWLDQLLHYGGAP
jgi:hypothetical protein